ncbi:MAG: hypothetical protein ABEJ83_01850 [Candidatus Nanohaloarchaea archaeon]
MVEPVEFILSNAKALSYLITALSIVLGSTIYFLGKIYSQREVMSRDRGGTYIAGFDIFVPAVAIPLIIVGTATMGQGSDFGTFLLYINIAIFAAFARSVNRSVDGEAGSLKEKPRVLAKKFVDWVGVYLVIAFLSVVSIFITYYLLSKSFWVSETISLATTFFIVLYSALVKAKFDRSEIRAEINHENGKIKGDIIHYDENNIRIDPQEAEATKEIPMDRVEEIEYLDEDMRPF